MRGVLARLAALALLCWALGFALFMVTLPQPASAGLVTDAVVVPTGARGRIERGLEVIATGHARRMLVTGTAPGVTRADLARVFGRGRIVACCTDLGAEAVDTRGNAEEIAGWVRRHGYRSIRLVTSDWHMRRARLELASELGREVTVVPDGVPGAASLGQLLNEYHKLLLRGAALWSRNWWEDRRR